MAFCPPLSILVFGSSEVFSAPCRSRVTIRPITKTIAKVRKMPGEIVTPLTEMPFWNRVHISARSAGRAPQISAAGGMASRPSRKPISAGISESRPSSSRRVTST